MQQSLHCVQLIGFLPSNLELLFPMGQNGDMEVIIINGTISMFYPLYILATHIVSVVASASDNCQQTLTLSANSRSMMMMWW